MPLHDTQPLTEGTVAYFVHLHLDTAKQIAKHAHREQHWVYEVEGKPRPMLILSKPRSERGQHWYRVSPLTTKGLNEQGACKPRHVRIGTLCNQDSESYVIAEVYNVPENLVHLVHGRSPVIGTIDRLAFGNILKIVQNVLLRS